MLCSLSFPCTTKTAGFQPLFMSAGKKILSSLLCWKPTVYISVVNSPCGLGNLLFCQTSLFPHTWNFGRVFILVHLTQYCLHVWHLLFEFAHHGLSNYYFPELFKVLGTPPSGIFRKGKKCSIIEESSLLKGVII